jgi:hypothetical protein
MDDLTSSALVWTPLIAGLLDNAHRSRMRASLSCCAAAESRTFLITGAGTVQVMLILALSPLSSWPAFSGTLNR